MLNFRKICSSSKINFNLVFILFKEIDYCDKTKYMINYIRIILRDDVESFRCFSWLILLEMKANVFFFSFMQERRIYQWIKPKKVSHPFHCMFLRFNRTSHSEHLASLLPCLLFAADFNFTSILLDYLHQLNGFLIACRVLLLALLKFHLQ